MGRRSLSLAMAAGVLLAGVAAVPAHANTPVACSDTALIQAINDSNAGLNDHILDLTTYCLYTLTDADQSLPTITQPLTVHGHNATIRRDPNATTDFRIFEVGATSLTMDTLTVMNGSDPGDGGGLLADAGTTVSLTDVNFSGNHAGVHGGAILSGNGVNLTMQRGTVSDNRSDTDAAGVEMVGNATTGTASFTGVTFTRNRAGNEGGAITVAGRAVTTIADSTISNNTAKATGGGIAMTNPAGGVNVTISGSTIADNRVAQSTGGGGGMEVRGNAGTITVSNSVISGNVVTGFTTPGVAGSGGGIVKQGTAPVTLDNTQVIKNSVVGAQGQGGGIAILQGSLNLTNGTLVTGNLGSGRYSLGGGLYSDDSLGATTVSVDASSINANKVTGTGSVSGGIYNSGGTVSLTNSSVNNNV
ncbi:hypothetical protein ABZ845_27795, partial [Streptomyces sp. NPDC047022]|uniref:hypothetical protein n=1 Tax=Streptomyces sp. NPDC047022 TaxID=3155737 RepID=UPI0033C479B9